eukprot:3257616-Amphidinium_carterae.1
MFKKEQELGDNIRVNEQQLSALQEKLRANPAKSGGVAESGGGKKVLLHKQLKWRGQCTAAPGIATACHADSVRACHTHGTAETRPKGGVML